jgi:geranylgeranyl transferase type-2 subunit alpha
VKTTAEQQEAKKKEREKKLQLYKATTSKIFEKVSSEFIISKHCKQ